MKRLVFALAWCALLSGCGAEKKTEENRPTETAVATLAGGCFWCMESPFEKIDGVVSAISGYAGGYVENPTYEQVSSGQTGHREAVQITYDPSRISYEKLLSVFWRQIDPTDHAGQFVDKGFQYTSAIFYHDEGQKRIAIASKKALAESDRFDKPIVTPVTEFLNFYPAEAYHQDFYLNHSLKYRYYRDRSGRDDFLNAVWGEENH